MAYRVIYTRTFLKEMSRLPAGIRERVEEIAFGPAIQQDPFLSGTARKLSGYETYYRIRVGDYRIGLRIDTGENFIEFMRACHRRDFHRRFP